MQMLSLRKILKWEYYEIEGHTIIARTLQEAEEIFLEVWLP